VDKGRGQRSQRERERREREMGRARRILKRFPSLCILRRESFPCLRTLEVGAKEEEGEGRKGVGSEGLRE